MPEAYQIIDHVYDAVVVGAGGSGLRAAMGIANASIRSGAKKGFFVKIHYGTKEYMIAKALRENRARALFDVLTA